VKQLEKLLAHNRFERKIQQLTLPMDMDQRLAISVDDGDNLVLGEIPEFTSIQSQRNNKKLPQNM
jgi:hypothetical protein